jgi:ABC-type sugar transport system substrate-binding protein
MIREAEALIAIWDGKSRGTDDAIRRARAAGIPVVVVSPKT